VKRVFTSLEMAVATQANSGSLARLKAVPSFEDVIDLVFLFCRAKSCQMAQEIAH
jgi:hypothetical protein